MIRNAGISYSAKVDRIEAAPLLQTIFVHHATSVEIGLATPIEMLPRKIYVMTSPGGFQNSKTFGHDFMPDAVSFDHCYLVVVQNASHPLHAETTDQNSTRTASI